MKKRNLLYTMTLCMSFLLFSCQGLVDDINEDPNSVSSADIPPVLYLTGAQLSNVSFQLGHLSRISNLYSGQLFGFASVYGDIYRYNISTAESNSSWDKIFVGVGTNTKFIVDNAPDDKLLTGIARVLEAHAIGSAASVFGDIPSSQRNSAEVEDPAFDSQIAVFADVQNILDAAISDLQVAESRPMGEDIHFNGDKDKWMATAYTLKARYYTITRDYANAYAAATNGIQDAANSFEFVPRGTEASTDDKNQFNTMLSGSRGGDIGSGDSYLTQLLDPASDVYRGNAKTDETARSAYSYVVETDGESNFGIIAPFEANNLVSYEENILTLAEAGARVQGFSTGLDHLNEYRAWLNGGGTINSNFDTLSYAYEAYDAADFAGGGIENPTSIDDTRALLKEIIEERYISGFLTWMPFDDHRRLRATDPDLVVPFPTNDASAPGHVERLPYPTDELNSNASAPENDPGLFQKTEVNR